MKNESSYVRKFASLFKKMPAAPDAPPQRDPVTQMVVAFLQWEATRKQGESAFRRIMESMVDNNDLRVSHAQQIAAIIGENYPRAEERVARMKDAMQEIYVREHAIHPQSIAEKSKKDIRAYFDSLPGMTSYVSACVLLLSYGAHVVPVDQKLANLLKAQSVVDASATVEQIEGFLERYFKSGEALDAHLRLQAWGDESTRRPAKPEKPKKPAKPAKAKAKAAAKPKKSGKKKHK